MPVHKPQLADSQRQIPIGSGLGFVYQHTSRTIHGLYRKLFLIYLGCIHIFPIMIPMPGSLPKLLIQKNGRGYLLISFSFMQLSPVINQRILQHHTLGQEKREARAFFH